MGHRHLFNTPQIFETDSEQGWNNADQPYMPMGRGPESSSIIHPVDNMTHQGGHFPSQWTPAPRASGYSSSILNGELPHYQPMAPVPSHDPLLHQSGAGNLHLIQDNYPHHLSSNIGGQTIPGVDGGIHDRTIGSSRGIYKRKSPGIHPMCDRASTSRYYDVGSSSDIHMPVDPWQEKHNTESNHMHWEYPPCYGGNSLCTGGEGALRNVRSRAAVNLETDMARTHLSSNSLHHSFSSRSSDQSSSVDFWGQSSNTAPAREWNRNVIPPATHGVTFGPDSSFFIQDPSPLNTPNSHLNNSLEVGGYNNDVASNRGQGPQNVNSLLNQPIRGVRSGYGQRSAPTFGASSSNFRPGQVAASDDGRQMVAESYPSRYPRAVTNLRFRNVDRSGRTFVSSDRYRPFTEETSLRDRLTPQGLTVVGHPPVYGSRTMFDQHRDMRLDIDNMSYEELLALGERIGSVNTGLSDGLISNCLTESIYCSSDLAQDEGTCVICLEEYKNMDDVGTLKACGHDFHACCIRKWLSMKNSCPICKSPAMDDGAKGK